jgi:hypothetical protein
MSKFRLPSSYIAALDAAGLMLEKDDAARKLLAVIADNEAACRRLGESHDEYEVHQIIIARAKRLMEIV